MVDLARHLLELVRVFEAVGATIGCIQALEVEIAASLTWCLAVAFDLASLTLVALRWRDHQQSAHYL